MFNKKVMNGSLKNVIVLVIHYVHSRSPVGLLGKGAIKRTCVCALEILMYYNYTCSLVQLTITIYM